MIYQLKVTLKHTQPPIWRRLQVSAETTFFQLHHILQVSFDWFDVHLHRFEVAHVPEHKRDVPEHTPGDSYDLFHFLRASAAEVAEIGDPEQNEGWGLFFNEKQEKLADWLRQEKDRMTYTYDFGDNWEHLIVLEKVFPAEPGVDYPRCVKARHIAPEEDSRGQWLDKEWVEENPDHQTEAAANQKIQKEINELLREMDDVVQAPVSFSVKDNREDWKALYEMADQFKRLKPWQWMNDFHMFAVVDPESEETGYCCVMGEEGEVYGLAVYVGEQGFRSLIEISEDAENVNPYMQRSLLLSLENRSDLAVEDYRQIKNLGLTYRGRNAWPVFRSLSPGYVPWFLEEWEVRFLKNCLEQVIHVSQRIKKEPQLLDVGENSLFARIGQQTEDGYKWVDGSVSNAVEAEYEYIYCYISEGELKYIRRSYPVKEEILECDISFFPEPVQVQADERPYFPRMYLCLDTRSRMVIDYTLVHPNHATEQIQQQFVELIQKLKFIPQAIHIDNEETYMTLIPLADQLGIRLIHTRLPHIQEAKESMFSSFF